MPFRLHKAPAIFQHFINNILREYLDIFISAYIDDLLIYSKTLREHKEHVRKVLGKLRENGLQIDIEKCKFYIKEVLYLGMIIGKHGIKMDPAKVAAIKEWARPENVKDVQSFMGFANFYRRFIAGLRPHQLAVLTRAQTSASQLNGEVNSEDNVNLTVNVLESILPATLVGQCSLASY